LAAGDLDLDHQELAWRNASAAILKIEEVNSVTLKKAVHRRGRSDDLFAHIIQLLKEMEDLTHSSYAVERVLVSKERDGSFLGDIKVRCNCCNYEGSGF
jgi:hypothetical protein